MTESASTINIKRTKCTYNDGWIYSALQKYLYLLIIFFFTFCHITTTNFEHLANLQISMCAGKLRQLTALNTLRLPAEIHCDLIMTEH